VRESKDPARNVDVRDSVAVEQNIATAQSKTGRRKSRHRPQARPAGRFHGPSAGWPVASFQVRQFAKDLKAGFDLIRVSDCRRSV